MGQRRPESGAPDHGIDLLPGTIGEFDTGRGEAGEHRHRVQQPGVTCRPDRWHDHDVAQGAHPAAGTPHPGRGDAEQLPPVDVIGEILGRTQGAPGDLAGPNQVRGDLGTGVGAAHHHHALAGVRLGPGIEGAVHLGAGEGVLGPAGRARTASTRCRSH